jgi:cell division transport system permease protein
MKSVRDHLMFLLPLLAILLGVEFFLVFNRVTQSAEDKLRQNYSILVVSEKALSPQDFRRIDRHIVEAAPLPEEEIAKEIARGMKNTPDREILAALPHFYSLHLDRYLSQKEVEEIRKKLLKTPGIGKVETFGENLRAKYNLFLFLKIILWSFVGLMGLVSLFLVLKQMEVWQMAHRERMQIMEIFGAPMLLRSGVLFRMGIVDALLATAITAGIFLFLRYRYAPASGIEILMEKQALLFEWRDMGILAGIALIIVITAVLTVAFKSQGPVE